MPSCSYKDFYLGAAFEHQSPIIEHPFKNNPTPDVYARITHRKFKQSPARFSPRTANRTSYTNLLTRTDDLTHSDWGKSNGGTGSAPTVSAGYTGPNGEAAFRVQFDKGAGTTSADISYINRGVSGLANPHPVTLHVWLKSNTASTYQVSLYGAGGFTQSVETVTPEWRRFTRSWPSYAATTDQFRLQLRGGVTSNSTADILVASPALEVATSAGPSFPLSAAALTISAPDLDTSTDTVVPADPFAYLVEESDPVPNELQTEVAFTRSFARIPADQVRYGSRVITKPSPSAFGTNEANGLDYTSGLPAANMGPSYSYHGHTWLRNEVYTRRSAVSTLTKPTGGTFTVSYKTSTTSALAYNASGATIAAAINSLADVISDGLTVTVANDLVTDAHFTITITVGSTLSSFVFNASSLTPSAAGSGFTTFSSVTSQNCCVGYRSVVTAHGFDSFAPLLIRANNVHRLAPPGQWVVVDADTVAHNWVLLGTTNLVGQKLRDYTPGTDRVKVRFTEKFYLPGVTVGISTPADIPSPDPLLNDAVFLQSVIDYPTGYQTYDATELTAWRGPIYTQTFIEIDMSDV